MISINSTKQRRAIRGRTALLASVALMTWPATARAGAENVAEEAATAEADEAFAADAELVVTGRRDVRGQEVQETPISITSLSSAKLEQQAITSTRELDNIVPNLYQARTVVSYLNARFFIRGVGEADEQGEPSVPVYQDGIYIPRTLGSQSELLISSGSRCCGGRKARRSATPPPAARS